MGRLVRRSTPPAPARSRFRPGLLGRPPPRRIPPFRPQAGKEAPEGCLRTGLVTHPKRVPHFLAKVGNARKPPPPKPITEAFQPRRHPTPNLQAQPPP